MPTKFPPWVHLERFLAPFPGAANALRRLVYQQTSVPVPPAGSQLLQKVVVKTCITVVDLLYGAGSRKDVLSLYRTPQGTFFCDRRRYSPSLVDFYFIEAKRCTTMAEVDAFFGSRWRSKHKTITPAP